MKKIISLVLVLLMILGMVACGGSAGNGGGNGTGDGTGDTTPTGEFTFGVYKSESFESAAEKFSQYGTSSYDALVNPKDEYSMLGYFNESSLSVGAKAGKAYSGEKALALEGIAPSESGSYAAKIKLSNLAPDDLTKYIGYTIKFSAYVFVDGIAGKSSGKSVSLRWGIMGDREIAEIKANTYSVKPSEWTLMEFSCEITEDLLNNDLGLIDGKHYPMRPFIGLGASAAYPKNIYVDDVTVEIFKYTEINLPAIFSDNMVLQRGKPVAVWGTCGAAGEDITVSVGKYSATGKVNENGEFFVELPAMEGSYSETLTISCLGNNKVYRNVGVGEVWYCSGQSNMQLAILKTHNTESLIADADNRDVRSFRLSSYSVYEKQTSTRNAKWQKIGSSNVNDVSAIAYITAVNLQKELDVPVAIIDNSLGGSVGAAWLSYEKIFAEDRADVYGASTGSGKSVIEDYNYYWDIGGANEGKAQDTGEGKQKAPAGLYNGVQYPLNNFTVAGVLWYQGESDSDNSQRYNYIIYDLIQQWREDFRDEDLPVVLFQLAPYSDGYKDLRQVQLDTAKRMDNVFLITTAYEGPVFSTARGDTTCLDPGTAVHPGTKIPVGERAAHTLLANLYGKASEFAAYCSPEYMSMTVNGNVATLTFSTADGLKIRTGDSKLTGFLAYNKSGGKIGIESAVIKGNTVVITTKKGTVPYKITYAANRAAARIEVSYEGLAKTTGFAKQYITVLDGNLENGKGQPAIPFVATCTNAKIHLAEVSGGNVAIEIRELGYTTSTYKVVVEMLKGTTKLSSNEYTLTFNTVDSRIISQAVASGATNVKISLYNGNTVVETKSVEIK